MVNRTHSHDREPCREWPCNCRLWRGVWSLYKTFLDRLFAPVREAEFIQPSFVFFLSSIFFSFYGEKEVTDVWEAERNRCVLVDRIVQLKRLRDRHVTAMHS